MQTGAPTRPDGFLQGAPQPHAVTGEASDAAAPPELMQWLEALRAVTAEVEAGGGALLPLPTPSRGLQQQELQGTQQPWSPTAAASGGGTLGAASPAAMAALQQLLSPVTPAGGVPPPLPSPLFPSPAGMPGADAGLLAGLGSLFGGSGGAFLGLPPPLPVPLGGGDGTASIADQLQEMPLWSAADVLPATLGVGGLPALPTAADGSAPTLLQSQTVPEGARSRGPRRKRARIMREGQLTMILYGANEALLWARRVAAFQHYMRGVLGDRRLTFSWGGSVLDSVVGVFLTQNVADHLSSRAYMELASRFPARRRREMLAGSSAPYATGALHGGVPLLTMEGEPDGGWTSREDSVDWDAVRTASHADLSDAIKCRGMQFRLADQISRFLNEIREHNLRRLRKSRRAQRTTQAVERAAEAAQRAAERGAVEGVVLDVVAAVEATAAFQEGAAPEAAPGGGSGHAATAAAAQGKGQTGGSGGSPRRHITLEYEGGPGGAPTAAAPAAAPAAATLPSAGGSVVSGGSGRGQAGKQGGEEEEFTPQELLSLEWLRDAPDDVARNYLMNIDGLGRKSVGCIMLLTLGKKEFPVDTNVGRICARLGWIPLDAEGSVEDLDDYAPEPEVHAYLHSRLLGFDVETLYELHYQMITLGKVFCNKQQPNCSACPMNSECEYAQNNGPSLHGRKRERAPTPPPGAVDLAAGGGGAAAAAPGERRRYFPGSAGGPFAGAGGKRRGRGSGTDSDTGDDGSASISGGSDSGDSDTEEDGESVGSPTGAEADVELEEGARGERYLTRRQSAALEAAGPKPTLRQAFARAMAESKERGRRVPAKTLSRLVQLHQEEYQAALQAQTLPLDELLALVARKPRTPGRKPARRFERARKLKRSRELAQLLQGEAEEERERLLEAGVAGRVAPQRATRRAAATTAQAAPGGGAAGAVAMVGKGKAVDQEEKADQMVEAAATPSVSLIDADAEESSAEEEASQSPEADLRYARGGRRLGLDADAAPMHTRHAGGGADGDTEGGDAGGEPSTSSGSPATSDSDSEGSQEPSSAEEGLPEAREAAQAAAQPAEQQSPAPAAHEETAATASTSLAHAAEAAAAVPAAAVAALSAPTAATPAAATVAPSAPLAAAPPPSAAAAPVPAVPAVTSAAEAAAPAAPPAPAPVPAVMAAAGMSPAAAANAAAIAQLAAERGLDVGRMMAAVAAELASRQQQRQRQEAAAAVAAAAGAVQAGASPHHAAQADVEEGSGSDDATATVALGLEEAADGAAEAGGTQQASTPTAEEAQLEARAPRPSRPAAAAAVKAAAAAAAGRLFEGEEEDSEDERERKAGERRSAAAERRQQQQQHERQQQQQHNQQHQMRQGPAAAPPPTFASRPPPVPAAQPQPSTTPPHIPEQHEQQATAAEPSEAAAAAAAAPEPLAAPIPFAVSSDAAVECERLEQCGQELAAAQRALLVAEGKGPGTDLSPHRLRLVELSLDIMGISAALTFDTSRDVMAAAKRSYRQLSMLVHPDRCALPSAEGAFAAASQAVDLLKARAEELERQPLLEALAAEGGAGTLGGGGGATAGGGGAGAGGGDGALVRFVDAEELLQSSVWNQNRLAVSAVIVPPEALRSRGLLHPAYQQQFAEGSSLAAEPLLFLPAGGIPTLTKRHRLLTAPPALQAAATAAAAAAKEAKAARAAAKAAAPPDFVQAQFAVAEAGAAGAEEGGAAAPSGAAQGIAGVADAGGAADVGVVSPAAAAAAYVAAGMAGASVAAASAAPDGLKDPQQQMKAAAEAEAGVGAGTEEEQHQLGSGGALVPAGASAQQQEEGEGDMVEGLLLVSARTALWGRFPLNGTYFQVNEVFADEDSLQIPMKLPRALVEHCKPSSVHFGHSIHFMCKGMGQAEVAHMFAHGFVCFRAFRADTGAPAVLPEFLQPSIPTKSNAAWKNAEQRAAERAAKLAFYAGLPPPVPAPPVRWLRVPGDGFEAAVAEVALPAVLPAGQVERGATGLELLLPDVPSDGLQGLGSPPKRKAPWSGGGGGGGKKKKLEFDENGLPVAQAPPRSRPGIPLNQDARDAKSGKGRKRLFLHPIIRQRDRCGTCPACLNLGWKKACMTRRAEQEGTGV